MAKTRRKRRNSEGKLKKVYRPSSTRKEKKHESHFQKFSAYNNRKAEEQQSKDMMARQAALDAMGMPNLHIPCYHYLILGYPIFC